MKSDPLTPEAKKRMIGNQLQAKIKLQHKRTPALHFSIGQSWFLAIEPEFKKPYFQKVFFPNIPSSEHFSKTHSDDHDDNDTC